jgi:hypothetical protein
MPSNYVESNWAPIPPEMISQLHEHIRTAPDTWSDRDTGVWETGQGKGNRPKTENYGTYDVPKNVEHWLRTTLPIPDHYTITIQRIRAGCEVDDVSANPVHTGPTSIHIDQLRESVYQFLITPSGPVTNWYELRGDRYEIIESVVCQMGKWYHLHTTIPHAVKGLTEDRMMVIVYKNARVHGFDGSTWDGIK